MFRRLLITASVIAAVTGWALIVLWATGCLRVQQEYRKTATEGFHSLLLE